MARHWAADELVIEIDGPRCEMYDFPPLLTRHRLRSRMSMDKLVGLKGATLHASIRQPVPGQHLVLDMKGRRGRVLDPMGWDEMKAQLTEINVGRKTVPGQVSVEPIPDEDHELNGPVRVATWLYHMRRAVQSGNARCVQDSPKKHLMCDVEVLEKIVPEWGNARVVIGTTQRDSPQTVDEMKIYNKGPARWLGYVQAQGMAMLAQAQKEAAGKVAEE